MQHAAVIRRILAIAAFAAVVVLPACVRMPSTGVTPLKPATSRELAAYLLDHAPDVEQFRARGPFDVEVREDLEVKLSASQPVSGDLYLAASPGKAPLVILLHGYGNSKDSHAYQAYHLASWGVHAYALDLPNQGPWVGNGRILAKVAQAIRERPGLLDARIDPDRIVLVGHSFGASSAAIALAQGAPAIGAVLLDPAAVGRGLATYLGKVTKSVVVLAADARVSNTRGRANFFRHLRGPVAEVVIKDAAHEDAEFPLEPEPLAYGESAPTEERQVTFVSALTAAAYSLAYTGGFDYAWAGFADRAKNERFIDPRKK